MTELWGLDTFCKAGGCTRGYQRAGFRMVGVDKEPQPRYVGEEFIQADALEVLADKAFLSRFAFVHASPPCQAFSWATAAHAKPNHPNLIPPTRELLQASGLPWVMENVPRAPLRPDFKLCGCMFGLPHLVRERWFETSWHAFDLRAPCYHPEPSIAVVGGGIQTANIPNWGRLPSAQLQPLRERAMGIDWMNRLELGEAIPPAYTEHIGRALLQHIKERAA